jgi:hypothetical protein
MFARTKLPNTELQTLASSQKVEFPNTRTVENCFMRAVTLLITATVTGMPDATAHPSIIIKAHASWFQEAD